MNRLRLAWVAAISSSLFYASLLSVASAADWSRFRGENGSGVAGDSTPTPVEWSEMKNLRWSAPLPGPGKSSPIVVGDRVIGPGVVHGVGRAWPGRRCAGDGFAFW